MSLELIRCPDCNGVVPADSVKCPRCGGPLETGARRVIRRIGWVLAILTALAMLLSVLHFA